MFKWLFGRKNRQESAPAVSASVKDNTHSTQQQAARTGRYTPAMDDVIRQAAPLNPIKIEQLASNFGPKFSTKSVAARARRIGVPFASKEPKPTVSTSPAGGSDDETLHGGSSSSVQYKPTPPSAKKVDQTIYLGVYCTDLRYEEVEGVSLPLDFRKAQREWVKSGNDPKVSHYIAACKLLSKWYVSEFSMVDSVMSVAYEIEGGGPARKTSDKYLSPAETIKSAFSSQPRLISAEVVAVDYREEPQAGPFKGEEALVSAPDVAVLAVYEAKLKPKIGSTDKLREWLNLNSELVSQCFSLEIKPGLMERTEVDEDGYEMTFSGSSWQGGDINIAVASGPRKKAREELVQRAQQERAELLGGGEAHSPVAQMIYSGDVDAVGEQLHSGLDVATLIGDDPLLKVALIALFTAEMRFNDEDGGVGVELKAKFNSLEAFKKALRKIVFLLLDAGADVNQPAGQHSIATVAEVLNDPEITPAIQARSGGQGNDVALIIAAEAGDTERVRNLLDQGTNVDVDVFKGTTPLMMAAQGPGGEDAPALSGEQRTAHENVVQLLLQRGANVNAVAHDGNTALGNAVRRGNTTIAKILLDAGARATGALPGGQSITELARQKRGLKEKP
jgi:hypothetical protein